MQGVGTEQSPVLSPARQTWDGKPCGQDAHMGHHPVASCEFCQNTWRAETRMPRGSVEKDNWHLLQKVFILSCKIIRSKHILVDTRPFELSLCTADDFLLIFLPSLIISLLDMADGILVTKD